MIVDSSYPEEDTMNVGGGRRLALAPDALVVETRSGGGWRRTSAIPYEDIKAVYRYETRDWSAAWIGAAVWLAALVILLTGGVALRRLDLLAGVFLPIVTVLILGAAAYRVLGVPRGLLRIEAYGASVVAPNRSPGFFYRLRARMPRPGGE